MFDELRQAVAHAEAEGRTPERWRFTPEGWDRLRRAIDADSLMIQWSPEARIKTVLGLPYVFTCKLPSHVHFELV